MVDKGEIKSLNGILKEKDNKPIKKTNIMETYPMIIAKLIFF